MPRQSILVAVALLLAGCTRTPNSLPAVSTPNPAPLQIVSWNVESGGAKPNVIAKQLAELPPCQIFALQEVDGDDIGRYGDAIRAAHGKSFRYLASYTGDRDRLMIAFDDDRLDLIESRELFEFGDRVLNNWRHRSPLVCLFRDTTTDEQFYFVTVHLARGDEKLRTTQAKGLAAWAATNGKPTIAAGDFNFDYNFDDQKGNEGFDAMLADGTFTWAKPAKLVDTNWCDDDRDGTDDYPNSCLDFAFTANMPAGTKATTEVIVREGDFPDDNSTSDHRALWVRVE